jgi:3-oxoadipate enol-lactonase
MPHASLNGIQLYYELLGREGQPVILFLHGLGSSAQDWAAQREYFEHDFRVLAADMRGHGQSDKPRGPYTMPQFAADVIALLDHLKIDRVHVVGLSMGGMIAFQLAVDYPGRLLSMTIINSGPAVVPRTLKDRFAIWMRFWIVRYMEMRKIGETLAPRLFVDPDQEALRQSFVERWAANDPRAYLDAMRAIAGWSVEDRINTISIPTLIIAADHDYTPVAAKEAYIAKMPAATLKVIENAHHAVAVERPDALNAIVHDFIQAQ